MNTHKEAVIPGLVQVYTGDGKGKTTAALGLALRAAGWDKKVIFIQFLKGDTNCGEHRFVNKHLPFEIVQPNRGNCFTRSRAELEPFVAEAFARAVAAATGGDYDVVILDEVFHAVNGGYIATEALLELMENKYPATELVLTGRGAPPEIIAAADLVTGMKAVKHPFGKGVKARKGIEY
jgi:cob(I)alamin adenosyltransferase